MGLMREVTEGTTCSDKLRAERPVKGPRQSETHNNRKLGERQSEEEGCPRLPLRERDASTTTLLC